MTDFKRRNIILIFIVLMLVTIAIIDISIVTDHTDANQDYQSTEILSSSDVEEGVFKRSEYGLKYKDMPVDSLSDRELEGYYKNRAYSGAPPTVPHPMITPGTKIGEKGCLQCHENGGYVEQFKAYAPVTPHPELVSCNQCHVPAKTDKVFRESSFERAPEAKRNNVAMKGSPPVIPHKLEMRENCLSCHAGPSAPKEIRVSHPERVNCRQCHVPKNTVQEFQRFVEIAKEKKENQKSGGQNE